MKNLYKQLIICSLAFLISNQIYSQTYCYGDSFTLQAQDYISGELQWQYSYDGINWFDYVGANELSLFLIPEADIYLRLQITDPDCLPAYYTNIQNITFIPNPTVANAGEDQLNINGTQTTLAANIADIGTGTWSIVSGEGGSIAQLSNPYSIFTGVTNETYILKWVIYNQCDFTQDFVTISFYTNTFTCGDNLIDSRDEQSYPTVSIGGKCWMAKNLNVGTMITGANNPADNGIIEKYCYADNTENCTTYGGLYKWDEAMNYSTTESVQGICPAGWHIPSDSEVKQLEISLGMTPAEADLSHWRGAAQDVGTKMKVGGSSGFEILMAGVRSASGAFMYLQGNSTEFGYIWTTTEAANPVYAWRRCWNTSNSVARYDSFNKQYSYSIRCVKN